MIVNSLEQINALRNVIAKNADASYASVRKRIEDMTPMQFFASVKFEKLGKDPIGGEQQNLIEQINQMYSDMVVLSAAEDLLNLYPGTSLVCNSELVLGMISNRRMAQSQQNALLLQLYPVIESWIRTAKNCCSQLHRLSVSIFIQHWTARRKYRTSIENTRIFASEE